MKPDRFKLEPGEFIPSLAEAVLGPLARSARRFGMGPSSRNHMDFLRQSFRKPR
jgi:hypothetical protein